MINRFFFLFSAWVFLFGTLAYSNASDSFPTHTQYTPIELKPAFLDSNNSYHTASVCFLGNGVGCGDGGFDKGDNYLIDTAQQCRNEGFNKTSCSLPTYLSVQCPYNDNYYAKCVTDTVRACKDTGYGVTSCGTGYVVESSCPYNSSYKKCKCNPCDGYAYTYAQATAQGFVADGSCQSCSTTKYKRKNNPCSGYTTCECGGEIGASVCYTGSVQKFNKCKNCDPCPNYYDCGGTWQYCTGTTCYADSKRCSVSCKNDYFPYECQNQSDCKGIYRNGYCSQECKSSCTIGSIYYADGSCQSPENHTASKTVLGIVVYVTDQGKHGQLISLDCSNADGSAGRCKVAGFGDRNTDISALTNYTEYRSAANDFDSCRNTDILLEYNNSTAAIAARNYCPTNATCKKWCLPAAGILANIYKNKDAFEKALNALNESPGNFWSSYMWSSTEANSNYAWFSMPYGSYYSLDKEIKDAGIPVRPVFEF